MATYMTVYPSTDEENTTPDVSETEEENSETDDEVNANLPHKPSSRSSEAPENRNVDRDEPDQQVQDVAEQQQPPPIRNEARVEVHRELTRREIERLEKQRRIFITWMSIILSTKCVISIGIISLFIFIDKLNDFALYNPLTGVAFGFISGACYTAFFFIDKLKKKKPYNIILLTVMLLSTSCSMGIISCSLPPLAIYGCVVICFIVSSVVAAAAMIQKEISGGCFIFTLFICTVCVLLLFFLAQLNGYSALIAVGGSLIFSSVCVRN